jgi:uncharacterized protein
LRLIKPHTTILNISRSLWDKAAATLSPFIQYDFLHALEISNSIGPRSGWLPLYFIDEAENAIFYSFIKTHSYGEYIFDWQWANAYQVNGLEYYPKLTSMIPFTPITTTHFIMPNFIPALASNLLSSYHEFYKNHSFSSSHFLFINKSEISLFAQEGYLIRESVQYHFINESFQDFEAYLQTMKGRKAKQIRKERLFPGLKITQFTGNELKLEHALRMYQFYLSTIDHKSAIDYLKQEFFVLIFETMKANILYIEATLGEKAVAGSLFFYDSDKLYGRYWGSHVDIENLHFELCYYQGIDFCLQRKLSLFEAGAQGEHKISRGFRPTRTYSAHQLKNKQFHAVVSDYIFNEKHTLSEAIEKLSLLLPYKKV